MPKPQTVELEVSAPQKTIEQWAAEKLVDPAMFAVAKAITPGWALGRETTEADFTAALERAGNLKFS